MIRNLPPWSTPGKIRQSGALGLVYTTFRLPDASGRARGLQALALQVKHPENAQSHQSDKDEINGDDQIEQPWHDQDQNAGDQSNDGRNVGSGNRHGKLRGREEVWSRLTKRIMSPG